MRLEAIAWGIGLVLGGAALLVLGYRYLKNYRDMADNHYWSFAVARPRLTEADPNVARRFLGIPLMALGLLILDVGISGLARL